MFKNTILKNLIRPLARRVGTAAAFFLVAQGYESPLVTQFVDALIACVLVGTDLLLSRVSRNNEVRSAVYDAMWGDR